MELSEPSAREIVREINSVLPQKINLMNRDGIIIASTDPERVGTFHGGAARIVREEMDELRIYDTTSYEGARPGTNFLLRAQGEPIGVLGITGVYEEILPLANVIRKMTELLVNEQDFQRQRAEREARHNQFLSELLTHSGSFLNQEFVARGRELGIDLQIAWRVLVIDAAPSEYATDASAGHDAENTNASRRHIYDTLYRKAHELDPRCHVCRQTVDAVLLSSLRGDDALRAFAAALKADVEAVHPHIRLRIGIDSPADDYFHLSDACVEARKALHSCHRKGNVDIKFYDEINMELFADTIPYADKATYLMKIFRGYTLAELQDALHTLECFYECDGSLQAAAAQLFIHKNTLQQHLRKIAQRTGYDPRSLKSSAVFYLVLYFYQDLQAVGYPLAFPQSS